MNGLILSSSMMRQVQAALLAVRGWRVVFADTREHGESSAPPPPYTMTDLAVDTLVVLDALKIERAVVRDLLDRNTS